MANQGLFKHCFLKVTDAKAIQWDGTVKEANRIVAALRNYGFKAIVKKTIDSSAVDGFSTAIAINNQSSTANKYDYLLIYNGKLSVVDPETFEREYRMDIVIEDKAGKTTRKKYSFFYELLPAEMRRRIRADRGRRTLIVDDLGRPKVFDYWQVNALCRMSMTTGFSFKRTAVVMKEKEQDRMYTLTVAFEPWKYKNYDGKDI